jgi:hypothetical protein
MADNEVENIYDPASCENFDVCGVVDRLDRTLYELATCESATTNDFNEYDQTRFLTMWQEVETYVKAIQGQERLDLPHSFPAMYEFNFLTQQGTIVWEHVKNSFVRDLARLTANAMVNWSRSESSDQSNRFVPADVGRWDLIYARGVAMVEEYAAKHLPGDKPESSDYELTKRGISAGPS